MRNLVVVRRALAALLAVLTAVLVAGDLAALHRHARALGPERRVVVATRDLPLGHRIEADDLASRTTRAALVPEGALTDVGSAADRVVVVPVLEGMPLTSRALVTSDRRGLDGVVPVGSRAVRVDPLTTPALEPGVLVDVYAAFPSVPGTTMATRAALVIDVGEPAQGPAGAPAVTILVDTGDVSRVADALAGGQVVLVLSPPEEAGFAVPPS
jgi:pilus assembly protein CpaB